jgi:prevent-host-death family protein
MASYSTSDLSRRSGDIIADALREPVMITQRNKPRLVLLSVEDYRRLVERGQTRRATKLDAMSDDLFAEFEKAVESYDAEREAP